MAMRTRPFASTRTHVGLPALTQAPRARWVVPRKHAVERRWLRLLRQRRQRHGCDLRRGLLLPWRSRDDWPHRRRTDRVGARADGADTCGEARPLVANERRNGERSPRRFHDRHRLLRRRFAGGCDHDPGRAVHALSANGFTQLGPGGGGAAEVQGSGSIDTERQRLGRHGLATRRRR